MRARIRVRDCLRSRCAPLTRLARLRLRSRTLSRKGRGKESCALHIIAQMNMAKKSKAKSPQGRSGHHRDRAQWRHRRDRGNEDQPHAHGLQHDHLRGARLHHRPVHAGGRDRVDRHRPADLHPRHGGDREGEDPPLRHQEHEAGRHLRHQRFLHDRQPSQPFHLHAADLPQGQAGRLLLLHGALARRRRPARRHDHGHLFRRHPDPDREVPGSRQGQPGPGRHHPHERAAAAARHGRPARAGHRGEDRRAAVPANCSSATAARRWRTRSARSWTTPRCGRARAHAKPFRTASTRPSRCSTTTASTSASASRSRSRSSSRATR